MDKFERQRGVFYVEMILASKLLYEIEQKELKYFGRTDDTSKGILLGLKEARDIIEETVGALEKKVA